MLTKKTIIYIYTYLCVRALTYILVYVYIIKSLKQIRCVCIINISI